VVEALVDSRVGGGDSRDGSDVSGIDSRVGKGDSKDGSDVSGPDGSSLVTPSDSSVGCGDSNDGRAVPSPVGICSNPVGIWVGIDVSSIPVGKRLESDESNPVGMRLSSPDCRDGESVGT
jgi:hypothetical protein